MQMTPHNSFRQVSGLVTSIHDVSPRTRAVTERMLTDLAALGVERVSLLVIPDHHHRGHFLADPDFCEWLRRCVDRGHEAVVHGYYHLREAKPGSGAWTRLVTESYTAGEGEFFDLSENDAFTLAAKGRAEFQQAGLEPAGFIAPAWLLGPDAGEGVRRAGFQYTTRIGCVEDLVRRESHPSQSLVYSVRAGWRRIVSLGWNGLLLRMLDRRPLVRIGLHPPDWQYPAIRDHARKCIARMLAGREAMTYEDWLARQRAVTDSAS